ncbi:TetR/AcrR family transcriptional regulator [Rugosimonospora africana]|uniref:TetR family transcriptional regulator n=1 Tax=Rugosimonospora africana TaxID=556532 RepID=A0A8J3R1Q7_9ACTN|nr:TetR/AcrR family transcriptional regulator [Rugosimonospora africana]GIH20018.1 TetR family transcriptional regulator [Rugosimonospora africana]
MQITKPDNTPPVDNRAEARRAQIIAATIDLLATEGITGTSFGRIVKAAGLSSTRLISYHFASKEALLQAVAAAVVAEAGARMRPALDAQPTAVGKLEAYIRSNLAFLAEYPKHAKAVVEIARASSAPRDEAPTSDQPEAAGDTPGVGNDDVAVLLLAQLFSMGQAAGEMRDFDPVIMARALRAAIDTTAVMVAMTPTIDIDHHADELVALFTRATAPEGNR